MFYESSEWNPILDPDRRSLHHFQSSRGPLGLVSREAKGKDDLRAERNHEREQHRGGTYYIVYSAIELYCVYVLFMHLVV